MWALIVHGGAKKIDKAERAASREGCLAALRAGTELLAAGGRSFDAVEAALRVLEADGTFNAGYGSVLNEDGEVEMSAAVMEGDAYNVGAVSAVKGVRHPVSVARRMLFEEPVLLTSDGARRYARERGLELTEPGALIDRRRHGDGHDTVGAVALDLTGTISVATSTGGLEGKPAGRVGDSPQPGCGYYADSGMGGVAFSGDGEKIARMILAARVMHSLPLLGCSSALSEALRQVERLEGEAGCILLSPDGEMAWNHNSPDFAVAYQSSSFDEPRVFLTKDEEQAYGEQQERTGPQQIRYADHHRRT